MKMIGLAVIALLVGGAPVAQAEFYKYVDGDGNVRYTDDATKIPEAQRDAALKYPEAASDASDAAENDPLPVDTGPAGDAAPDARDAGDAAPDAEAAGGPRALEGGGAPMAAPEQLTPEDRNLGRQELEDRKTGLDAAYRALSAEVEAFQVQKPAADTVGGTAAYNERVAELNRKIQDYEERRQDLNRRIEEYNRAAGGERKKVE